MTARIISLVNQKGGTGKTTITMNLGAALNQRHQKKVLIVDCDVQGSAFKWYGKSKDNTFPCAVINVAQSESGASKAIKGFIDAYDYILVDCPPSTNAKINGEMLLISDLSIVVFKPGGTDGDALGGILELINSVKGLNIDLKSKILFNMCLPSTNLSKTIIEYWRTKKGLEFMDTQINTRAVYSETAVYGGYVYNTNSSQAKNEIALLTDEVISVFD